MRGILFDSSRAGKRFLGVVLTLTAVSLPFAGCQSKVQNTSIDIGGGMRKGEPPMCFQFRSEVRATMRANDILLHVNNSCKYSVDCLFRDNVSEKERRLAHPAYQAESYVLAEEVPTKRVDIDAECTWKP